MPKDSRDQLPRIVLEFENTVNRQKFVDQLVEGLLEVSAARLNGDEAPNVPARLVKRWGLE